MTPPAMSCEDEENLLRPSLASTRALLPRESSVFCASPSPHISSWVTMPTPVLYEGVRRRSEEEEALSSETSNNKGSTLSHSPKKKPCRRLMDSPASPVLSNPTLGEDRISTLPDECIHLIFSLIPSPRDRCSCAAVSRKWLLLQGQMHPSDFRPLPATTTPSFPQQGDKNAEGEDPAVSRCLHSHKANDARLVAIAVGACARGAPTELIIRATTTIHPAPLSSLLAVSDMGLDVISRACPELRSLVLWGCVQISNAGLAAVARHCPALEKLHISNAPLIDDGGLVSVALSCPKLSDLSLDTWPGVGDGALRALALFSSNLESITLENCPLVGDAGLVAAFSSLPRLAKVRIADVEVGDAALAAIGARGDDKPVRSVCLENVTGFTYAGFRLLGTAASLQNLTVRCCAGLSDACFGNGGNGIDGGGGASGEATFVGLKSVTVRSCGALTDMGLMELSETSKQLESLQLEKCHGVTTAGLMGAVGNWSATLRLLSLVKCNGIGATQQQQREQGAVHATRTRCPLLQSLTIKRCPRVGDQFLSVLGRALVKTRRIAVVGMGSVTDRGFISLLATMESRCELQSVDLSGCPVISDWSVAALVSASGGTLRRLALEGCEGVTDRSMRMIGRLCPGLVELDLSRCRRISDDGVAGLLATGGRAVSGGGQASSSSSISERKSLLEVLSLEGCGGITDESLSCLEEMVVRGRLAGLNLKHCGGLSRAGIDSVRQTLWWCDLIY